MRIEVLSSDQKVLCVGVELGEERGKTRSKCQQVTRGGMPRCWVLDKGMPRCWVLDRCEREV